MIARGFHWTGALIVLALLSLGFYMGGLEYSPFKFSLYFWHKSFGILVLILMVLRLGWRIYDGKPQPLESHEKWEKALSKIVHILLYFGLFVMPLSGWFMSSAGDFPASFFGLFELPKVFAKDEVTFNLLRDIHGYGAYALIVAVGLHALGAIKHHLIDKDETLIRMGGHTVIIPAALILLAAPVFLAGKDILSDLAKKIAGASGQASQTSYDDTDKQEKKAVLSVNETSDNVILTDTQQSVLKAVSEKIPFWVIIQDESHIKFEAIQSGQAFEGRFEEFDGNIFFDPENLQQSYADITIDITSIKTGSDDRDIQAKGMEWFDVNKFANAFFQVRSFEKDAAAGANHYIAKGYLTIKGVSVPVELPFMLVLGSSGNGGQMADMEGMLSLKRLGFGIGQGKWESTDTIGNDVKIMISVHAESAVVINE